jgi:hypothetical protein
LSAVTVTPTGVREGDPAALEALCAARGPSVVAYCRHVAGEADAGVAAADAFARFRVGVVAAGDTSTLNPEALLISATRTSAAARAKITALGHCAAVPAQLAARAEKTISPDDLARLEAHLETCWACRAPVARFKAAERAYRDPPEKTVEPALAEQIVAALIAAVPPPPPPLAVSPNGAGPQGADAPVADPSAAEALVVEQPTEHFAAAGMIEPDAGSDTDVEAEGEAGAPPRRRREKRRAGAGLSIPRLRPARGPRERPQRQPKPPPVPAGVTGEPAGARERRERREGRDRSRPGLRLAVVLPIILILLALLGALYVSGVFGGNDPESSPRVSVPAPVSAVDAVPGAKNASADAVEVAKARARGDVPATPKHKPKKKQAAATSTSAPAATTPPAPVTTPPPPPAVANNPAPRPAPRRDTTSASDAPKRIDAGSGATGAEQIPPAADATDVPELAPPVEPAAP